MEITDYPFVFQTDSNLVKESLKKNSNYLIEYSEYNAIGQDKYCAVYFSSNNIYYPNSPDVFRREVLHKNRYEWYGERIRKASKHIFIRDNKKQWYLEGINSEINTIERLCDFLKAETEGYKTVMLGSSAGGYAAVLFGSLLKSEYILSFNGQFKLNDLLESSNESIDPIIFRERNNILINQYFSLNTFISNPSRVYYFYSNNSRWDVLNMRHVEKTGINMVSFNTSIHGIPFIKSALPTVINSSRMKLDSWNNGKYNPLLFSIKYGGVFPTFYVLCRKLLRKS